MTPEQREKLDKIHSYLANMSNLCNSIAAFIDANPAIFDQIDYHDMDFFPFPYSGGHIEINARGDGKKIARIFNQTFPGTEWTRTNETILGPFYSASFGEINVRISKPEPRPVASGKPEPLEL